MFTYKGTKIYNTPPKEQMRLSDYDFLDEGDLNGIKKDINKKFKRY